MDPVRSLVRGSRSGVDGVRDGLGGRATAGRVKLDAEVLVRPARVVAVDRRQMVDVLSG